ncbi:MAG: hypothetical protein ACLP6G_05950 [Terriglobales bacterium]
MNSEELKACYAVIRHNVRTYESGGVAAVIKGKQNAETTAKQYESGQSMEERQAGWRYFCEKTDLKPGTNPEQATRLRQAELETRESKALQDERFLPPFSNSTRH